MRLHLNRIGHIGEHRDARELGGQFRPVDFDIVGYVTLGQSLGFQNQRQLLRLLLDLDHVANLYAIARDCHALAIHADMAVADELTRGKHRGYEFGAEDERIQSAFKQANHVRTTVALEAPGFLIDAAELPLGDVSIIAAQFLLGLELNAVVGELALAPLAVLAGAILTPVHRALRSAPDVLAHPAVDLVLGFHALGHSRPRVLFAIAEDRALLCPGRAGTDRQKPRKRKALPRVAKRPANLKSAGRAGFRSDRRVCQTL